MNVPEGFQPLFRSSPLLDLLGPFFCRHDAQRQLVVALRIDEKHCNHGGTATAACSRPWPTLASATPWRSPANRRSRWSPSACA